MTRVDGLILPISRFPSSPSVNQRLPSDPAAIEGGPLVGPGSGNSSMTTAIM